MAGKPNILSRFGYWLKDTVAWAKKNKWFVGSLILLTTVLGLLFPPSLMITIPLFTWVTHKIRNNINLSNMVQKHQLKLAAIILLFTAAIFLPLIPAVALFFKNLTIGIGIGSGTSASGFLGKLFIAFENITASSTILLLFPLACILAGFGKWKLESGNGNRNRQEEPPTDSSEAESNRVSPQRKPSDLQARANFNDSGGSFNQLLDSVMDGNDVEHDPNKTLIGDRGGISPLLSNTPNNRQSLLSPIPTQASSGKSFTTWPAPPNKKNNSNNMGTGSGAISGPRPNNQ